MLLKPFFSSSLNYQTINRINFFDQIKLNKQTKYLKTSKLKDRVQSYKNLMERNFYQLSELKKIQN